MGQYYNIIAKDMKTGEVFYNHRKLVGYSEFVKKMKEKHPRSYWDDYIMAKLMEHSWNSCCLMTSVAHLLKHGMYRLVWCGDYAEPEEIKDITGGEARYGLAWPEEIIDDGHIRFVKSCSLKGNRFINHTKGVYIDLDDYMVKSTTPTGWCISPISLMTAVGNGRGGGDYHGVNEDVVGSWAWDEISIGKKIPEGFKKLDIGFSWCD